MSGLLMSLAVVLLGCGDAVHAEQVIVQGMGRTQGWVVASDDGELAFVDCHGRRSLFGSARIEPSAARCPSPPAAIEVNGIVRSIDVVRRIVRTEESDGRVQVFYVTDNAARLEDLRPGERIHGTGPVAGQLTRITRP
jgi:hypothetical protein